MTFDARDFMSDPIEEPKRRRHRYKPATVEHTAKKAIIVKAKTAVQKIVQVVEDLHTSFAS